MSKGEERLSLLEPTYCVCLSTTWRSSPRLQEKVIPGLNLVTFIHKSCSRPALFPNLQKKLEEEDQLNPKEVNKEQKSEIEK